LGDPHEIHGEVAVGGLARRHHGHDHSWSPILPCRSGHLPAAMLGVVDEIVVEPSGPLRGTVRAGGAKNSALKLMAGCLLAEGTTVLSNVPRISDVEIMADVLRS